MSLDALFVRFEAWPVLLVAPLAWLLMVWLDRRRVRRLDRIAGPRAAALSANSSDRRRAIRRGFFCLGLLLGLGAALGPVFGRADRIVRWRGIDVVVCLDVSRSMLAGDLPPNRLARAHREIEALAERAVGDRLGLVVFAGEARPIVPLTEDRASFAGLAAVTGPTAIKRGGSDLGAALEAALALLDGGAEEHSAVVILTDGEDHSGRALAAADALAERDVSVHCVGFGTTLGGKIALGGAAGGTYLRDRAGNEVVSILDATSLRRIADATDGEYVDASTTDGALVDLYEDHLLPKARRTYESDEDPGRGSRFQWFLLVAFAFWLLHLMMTNRTRR